MSSASLPEYLSLAAIDAHVARALAEDLGDGDNTSLWTINPATRGSARLVAKETGILAGTVVADRVFYVLDNAVQIHWETFDGENVEPGQLLATLSGPLRSMLSGERVMLNYVQRMSGIASHTNEFVTALRDTSTQVLDTRKTAPGLRHLDKWSVLIGGGVNHRLDLSDEVMIKENHIAAAGDLRKAIESVDRNNKSSVKKRVVVEITSLEQIGVALDTNHVDRLLLDNMVTVLPDDAVDVSMLISAVNKIGGRVATEASGKVSLGTVRQIAESGVNYISVGALTHSVRALDISLIVQTTKVTPGTAPSVHIP